MLVRLDCERAVGERSGGNGADKRFVLHRHRDRAGAHLDLRLEQDGYLMGYRVDGDSLAETVWATVKAPHPVSWLTGDGDAIREDGGTYYWESGDATEGRLVLCGARETIHVGVSPVDGVSASDVAEVRAAADALAVPIGALAALAEDGKVARERAIARFCGLGRELDGATFDDGLWRRTLSGEKLAVVQQYLHGLEVRFDRKYPPVPVSKAESLEEKADSGDGDMTGRAMGIIRS